jgi:hypothetical protein
MAILWGLQQVVYQLIKSHETLAKYLSFLQVAICEKGFSKQKSIKNHLWASLKLNTLDALMQISLCGIEIKNKDWRVISEL